MIESIVALLNVIAGWIEKYRRKRQEETNQAERNDVEADTIRFFDSHFGGVSPDDADKADKTNANEEPRP